MLSKWLSRLKQWIKTLYSPPKKSYSPAVIQRWESANKECAVLQMERNTPGAIATYRINSRFPEHHYLITLDYLPEFYAELWLEKQLTLKYHTPFRLRQQFKHCCTHRFGISQILLNGGTRPLKIWDVNLESTGLNSNLTKLAPLRAVRAVAWRQLITPDPNVGWIAQIQQMDWLGLLEMRIKQELCNQNHDLKAILIFPKPEKL